MGRRRARRGPSARSLLFLVLASCAPALARTPAVWSPGYEAAILRYRAGGPDAAASEVCAWPTSRLRDEVKALAALRERARRPNDPDALTQWEHVPVRAALLLHTDCSLGARERGTSPEPHEWAAAEIAGMLRDDPANWQFAQRWYAVMSGLAAGENRWYPDAIGWAERGLRDYPRSAELLVAVGAIEEGHALKASRDDAPQVERHLADSNARGIRSEMQQRLEVQGYLEKARQALAAAIAADPSRCEAHLRLGRVAWRLGRPAEARTALAGALSSRPTRGEAFLAHLFLGRVEEDAGRLDEAARSYGAALALEVNSQSARLALSHLRLRQGDAATARAEAERALRPGGARLRSDPFWLYPWAPSVGARGRLEALRREARS
jgi:tetratricopeptide (TPR) repeat protein